MGLPLKGAPLPPISPITTRADGPRRSPRARMDPSRPTCRRPVKAHEASPATGQVTTPPVQHCPRRVESAAMRTSPSCRRSTCRRCRTVPRFAPSRFARPRFVPPRTAISRHDPLRSTPRVHRGAHGSGSSANKEKAVDDELARSAGFAVQGLVVNSATTCIEEGEAAAASS